MENLPEKQQQQQQQTIGENITIILTSVPTMSPTCLVIITCAGEEFMTESISWNS